MSISFFFLSPLHCHAHCWYQYFLTLIRYYFFIFRVQFFSLPAKISLNMMFHILVTERWFQKLLKISLTNVQWRKKPPKNNLESFFWRANTRVTFLFAVKLIIKLMRKEARGKINDELYFLESGCKAFSL